MGRPTLKQVEEGLVWRDRATLTALHNQGLTPNEIARELGCSRPTVVRWMDEFDLLESKKPLDPPPGGEITHDWLHRVRHEEHYTLREIANAALVSHETVRTILGEMEGEVCG